MEIVLRLSKCVTALFYALQEFCCLELQSNIIQFNSKYKHFVYINTKDTRGCVYCTLLCKNKLLFCMQSITNNHLTAQQVFIFYIFVIFESLNLSVSLANMHHLQKVQA